MVTSTLTAVRQAKHPGVEAGVFWLGRRGGVARVEAVVIPEGRGVDQLPGCWRVSTEVFGRISAWASTEELDLLAVCHTHSGPSPAKLSRRDRTHSVKAPGVLAAVIGRDGDEPDWQRWGWYVWRDGDYRLFTPTARSRRLLLEADGAITTWRADAVGVTRA